MIMSDVFMKDRLNSWLWNILIRYSMRGSWKGCSIISCYCC